MAKKRVHELGEELGKTNKEIMTILTRKGIHVTSHMSILEENQIEMVRKTVEGNEKPKMENQKNTEGEAPKKKNISQVFHPQNSRTGMGRPGQRPQRQGAKPNGQQGERKSGVKAAQGAGARPQTAGGEKRPAAANGAASEKRSANLSTMGVEKRPSAPAVQAEKRPTVGAVAQAAENRPAAAGAAQAENRTPGTTVQAENRPAPAIVSKAENRPARGAAPAAENRPAGAERRPSAGANGAEKRPAGSERRPQGGAVTAQSRERRPQGTGNASGDRRRPGSAQGEHRTGASQGERRGSGGDRRPQNGDRRSGMGSQGGERFGQGERRGPSGDRRPQGTDRRGGFQGQDGEKRPFQGNSGDRRGGGQRGGAPIPKAPIESKPLTKESRTRTDRNDKNRKNSGEDKFDRLEKKSVSRTTTAGKNQKNTKQQVKPAPVQEKKEDVIKNIILPETMTIRELADKMKIQAAAIVKKLFMQGKIVTVNHEIDYDTAEEIALEFNCIAEPEVKVDVIAELLKEGEEDESKLVPRPPVVCVMGHVDHGKTSLLDAIRHTHVIAKEAGGITQHIGAYVVNIDGQRITFLDTPGHEAFTAMRMRGANATDIAILVVAADDGVMPQTIEAINHAKAAGIEIIVAINKVDKPSANIERVKQELSEYELIPEDWGGSTICVPVSAHTKEGIDSLLEMILLTAEVNELKANPDRTARGLVIEAQLDKGKGPVATVLVQKGTLHVGDPIAAGSCFGKVRAMIDDKGRRLKEAGPSVPVEILGLSDVPNAGEIFVQTESEKEARSFAETFISENKEKLLEETKAKMSLDDLFSQIQAGNLKELNIIVKADVQGSVEAVKQSLLKLSNEEVVVKIIHGGVGAINESDVTLAATSSAIIIGFNVRPDATAKATAEREGVDLRLYRVIYDAIADVEAAMKGMLDPIYEEKVIGHAEVRQTFKASGVGTIAGSYILDGTFQRNCKVRISREGTQIYEGALASLKRFKDDVKEVKAGYECGLVFEKFNDLQEFDQVEAYIMVEVPR